MYSLCCISNDLKKDGHSFQTMTWKRFNEIKASHGEKYAMKKLGEKWLNNIEVTRLCINHCASNGWGYRVSSSLFPLLTHPDFQYTFFDIGQHQQMLNVFSVIKNENRSVRLSCHPDQFNVLASNNNDAVAKTIRELNMHGWMMDLLGCERSYKNPINIHVNCNGQNLEEIAERFFENLMKCDDSVISRLVVENEDKGCWNVQNLLKHFTKEYNIPITFDNLHHHCNPGDLPSYEAMTYCGCTWNVKPLFHYSESDPDSKNPRAHADFPIDYPKYTEYDWEIELKAKDEAIRVCELYSADLAQR